MAVVASLGQNFRALFPGITVFGNRGFDQPVPDWGMDAEASQDVISAIQQHSQLAAETLITAKLNWPMLTDSLDRGRLTAKVTALLLAQARAQGADTLLIVMPAQNVHSNARPGFGLAGMKLFGQLHECIVASIGIFVLRVSDGHWIGQQIPDPCVMKSTQFQLKNSWGEYSNEEQSTLHRALKEGVALQIDEMLDSLRLTKNASPGGQRPATFGEDSKP